MTRPRGFTLIELLVVIAIIGILASIVLASLGSARSSGRDAYIKSQVSQMRNLFALEMAQTGSYTGLKANGGVSGTQWRKVAADCASSLFTGPNAAKMQSICQGLVDAAAGCGLGTGCFLFGAPGGDAPDKFSIMIALPGASGSAWGSTSGHQWFCMGSSGTNYTGPLDPDGAGPILILTGSGCLSNP